MLRFDVDESFCLKLIMSLRVLPRRFCVDMDERTSHLERNSKFVCPALALVNFGISVHYGVDLRVNQLMNDQVGAIPVRHVCFESGRYCQEPVQSRACS